MKKLTASDLKERDEFMIKATGIKFVPNYDCERFEGLSAADLALCVKKGWADPTDAQNSAPEIGSILKFMKENPHFTAHGYVIGDKRADTRISIEGVGCKTATLPEMQAFIDEFHGADEFDVDLATGTAYAWFD